MRWSMLLMMTGCAAEAELLPMAGPGFEEERLIGEPQETYVVALTELHVINAPGPGKRFGALTEAVIDDLYPDGDGFADLPGWQGAAFRNVGRLHWWTMSVWSTEQDMGAFMIRPAHLAAMMEIGDVAKAATSLHLEVDADDLPLDWDAALDLLAAEPPIDLGR